MTNNPDISRTITPERRQAIFAAYTKLRAGEARTDECINFVRKQCRKTSLSNFLDTASDIEVRTLERLLKK